MSITWQLQDPAVLLKRPIKNLQELVREAGIPYSDMQLLQKGLAIIFNTRDFEYVLTI